VRFPNQFKESKLEISEGYAMLLQNEIPEILSKLCRLNLSTLHINPIMSREKDCISDEIHFYLEPNADIGHKHLFCCDKSKIDKLIGITNAECTTVSLHHIEDGSSIFKNVLYIYESHLSLGQYGYFIDIAIWYESTNHYLGSQYIDYNEYINSDKWRDRRNKILKRDGFVCQRCKAWKNLQVHHLTYDRLGFENDLDLVTLCKSCHEKLHDKK